MDVEKIFNDLESNNSQEYEETKKKLGELFNQTKEQWLVQGMMEYFLKTNSFRIIEVLVKVQSPHDKYIFDRLSDWIRGQNKLPALAVFGFIVRKHPTWLYKVIKHGFIKDILRLLQTEKEIIPLMSALLCMITLLPIIPSLVPNILQDLFDVFGYLASWNSPTRLTENHLIHLQIGLYMLFHRLYGMYPCNFLQYLRDFIVKEKGGIFHNTIRPLLETVRIHPLLVTATRESELINQRWKEMEPHDVVVECAKLSLNYYQDNSECFSTIPVVRPIDSILTDTAMQLQNSLRNTPFRSATGVTSPFYSIMGREKINDYQKFDSIWSPSIEILATPPPTGTVPHTPTPTPAYGVPTVTSSSTVLDASGASPPEAAVEATPETTPMKDLNLVKRTIVANSPAVRAILGSSQPSSPLRKEQSPFHFPESTSQPQTSFAYEQTTTFVTTQHRLIQMMNDRNQTLYLRGRSGSSDGPTPVNSVSPTPFILNDLQSSSGTNMFKTAPFQSLDSPSTQEDQEVTELTSQQMGPHHSDTLQDISAECGECDEPSLVGGLHVPTSRTMRISTRRIKRNRMGSYCPNDNRSDLSYGTSPAEKNKVRRTKSWPAMKRQLSLEEDSLETDISPKQVSSNQNGDSSSPSADDAISAATHFKKEQQKKERKFAQKPIHKLEIGNRAKKITCATQTLEQWPQIYEQHLQELLVELNKSRIVPELNTLQPYEILDQYIERTIKMKHSAESKNWEELLRDQIQLLHLQLQYERYRREIHAERNRRLLGKSRVNRSLEMDNERLKNHVNILHEEVQTLHAQLNKTRRASNAKEQEILNDCDKWKTKYNTELEDNKQLRSTIDSLQRRLNEEIKFKSEITTELEVTRGELFDTRNDMQQAQFQAELGNQYKKELSKLQSDVLLMGETQIKCRDRLSELDNLKARDDELNQLQEAYNEEVKDLRNLVEIKSAQLDTTKIRLTELQSQLASRDGMFTDLKRLLKSTKEEYQEKLNALEKKYASQKAIILQMERHIAEMYKNQTTVNLATFSPESDRADMAGSVEHSSPLSTSFASSEGLSASLRSVSEFRNLQALVQPNPVSGSGPMVSSNAPVLTSTPQHTVSALSTTSSPLKMGSTSNQSQYFEHQRHVGTTSVYSSFTPSVMAIASSSSSSLGITGQPGPSIRTSSKIQQTATSSTSLSSATIATSSSSSSSASTPLSATSSSGRPVPGPSKIQHHPHLHHHYSSHRK